VAETSGEIRRVREAAPGFAARARRGLRLLPFALAVLLFLPYYLTGLYILMNPPVSALMLQKALAGNGITYRWRDLGHISPNLAAQVIASEDGRFCDHSGVDWGALDAAADALAEGRVRGGGSTISMQTAKNLFLWQRPAFLRKPLEIPLAIYLDFVLGKRRLLEIYLNIVEWAPGVYGAEAAAQHHFGKSAISLTVQEAAQLAAALPNPKRRNAGRPGARVFALAERLKARAARSHGAAWCVLGRKAAGGEFEEED
jgi:monofunctional glycosyltransferase